MKFGTLPITVNSVDYTFNPYDRGQNGAFVWRLAGESVFASRVVASATANDSASDKLTVQLNTPRICAESAECGKPVTLGTDLVKTELRFLATTSSADRELQIDQHIELLLEMKSTIVNREVIYS